MFASIELSYNCVGMVFDPRLCNRFSSNKNYNRRCACSLYCFDKSKLCANECEVSNIDLDRLLNNETPRAQDNLTCSPVVALTY
jgi:hypothetical protein